MGNSLATPVVGNAIDPSLAAPEAEVITPPEEETTAAPADPEGDVAQPIDRRSRRAGKKEPSADTVDLTQVPEFQRIQAEHDRKLEEERQRRFQLERQMQERQEREVQGRLGFLQQQIEQSDDPDERKAAYAEALALGNQLYTQQMQAWVEWKTGQIKAKGLDPQDTRFNRAYSSGQTGLAEFQADLTAAENDKLRAELKAAKQAADPSNVSSLVRKEVARMLKLQGVDEVDLGEPVAAGADDGDAQEHDIAKLQSGQMSPRDYLKKWGKT